MLFFCHFSRRIRYIAEQIFKIVISCFFFHFWRYDNSNYPCPLVTQILIHSSEKNLIILFIPIDYIIIILFTSVYKTYHTIWDIYYSVRTTDVLQPRPYQLATPLIKLLSINKYFNVSYTMVHTVLGKCQMVGEWRDVARGAYTRPQATTTRK